MNEVPKKRKEFSIQPGKRRSVTFYYPPDSIEFKIKKHGFFLRILTRLFGKTKPITITGMDQYGFETIHHFEIITYPKIIRWLLRV